MNYYSEYSEDEWIDRNLNLPEKGVYVDCGAAYPFLRSNTAFLRERGWKGVAIEGNPYYLPEWTSNLVIAVLSQNPEARFDYHYAPDLSGIRPEGTPVRCRTLESILIEYGIEKVDFLSLDLEGSEFDALLSMNIARHEPSIIVSEYATAGKSDDWRVRDYLNTLGYKQVHQTVANAIYTK